MSRVTVFMPVYNAEKYLHQAIESILQQTYEDFELLIIDDGSTDKSISVIETYSDSRIRLVVNNHNTGLSAVRNKALEIIDSEFLALLDADDIAMPDRLKKEIEYLDKNSDIAAVGSYAATIDENGCGRDMFRPQLTDSDYIRAYMIFNNAVANSSAMIRKSVVDENNIRYADCCYGVEDYKFWCELLKVGNIANIGEMMLKYRIVSDGVTAKANSNQLNERKEVLKEIQKDNIEFYGFDFSDEEINVLLEIFTEDEMIHSIEKIEMLYRALKSMVFQAYSKKMKFAKKIEIMCRKRFGEKVAKAVFLWNEQ